MSDRDPVFTSSFWSELFRLAGSKLHLSSAFHPQSDGQTEVVNRVIGMYLRCLSGDRPKDWLRWLPCAEFCYNSSFQTALRATPFRVVYGRDPPALVAYEPGIARLAAVDNQLVEQDEFLSEIRERLLQAQNYMKEHYDKTHRDVEFQVGQWVWLRLHSRAVVSLGRQTLGKLSPRFFGPYKILQRVGEVAYQLQLPPRARLHDVFHVSLLKPFHGEPSHQIVPLPALHHGRVLPNPAQVLRSRYTTAGWEVLVRWDDLPATDTSWLLVSNFRQRYPHFQLEDELFLQDSGNVMDSFFGRKYTRRAKPSSVTAVQNPTHARPSEDESAS